MCEEGSGSYGNELKGEMKTLTPCKWIMETLSRRGFRVVPLLCSIVVCCDWARAQDIIGVNAVNLAWQPAAVREIVLDEIAGSGIRDVRLSLIPPYEASLDVLRVAKVLRLKVLLNIGLNVRLFYSGDVKPQPAGDGLNEAWPLSALDPAMFAATMRPFWRQIVAEELPVRAVEVGNEINWADFNGDLRRHLAGQSDSPDSLEGLPERDAFRTGLERYMALLRLIREWRSESLAARKILIVSAGLATVPPEFARQMGLDVVTPADTLNVLRGEGLTAVADRIGIRVYANAGLSATASRTNLWSTLKPCVPDVACWITEWGVADSVSTCPLAEKPERSTVVLAAREVFARAAGEQRVSATFLFNWDGPDPRYSVWRCGQLTTAGRNALLTRNVSPRRSNSISGGRASKR
jgi:hypothetical protein